MQTQISEKPSHHDKLISVTASEGARRFFQRTPLLRLDACILSGVLLAFCFPLPNLTFLVWVACVPLILAVISEPNPVLGFLWGFLTGVVFLSASLYWFVGVMRNYGQLSLPEALAAMVLFLVMFAPFWGAFGVIESLAARHSAKVALALAPFLWVSMELARTYLITGFPWNLLGYAVRPQGLEQVASVTAIYGPSFLGVVTSALLAWLILEPRLKLPRWIAMGWVALLIVGNTALAPPPIRPARHLAVLVQPDVPLNDQGAVNWTPWQNPVPLQHLVQRSLQSAAAHRAGSVGDPLIVWSENSAPFFFDQGPLFRGAVQAMAQQGRAFVVVNTITFAGPRETRPQNTAIVLNPSGQKILEYHKIHLVPMGEYVPWWLRFTRMSKMTSEVSDFVPGFHYSVAHTPQGNLGVFICYEDIFPQLVRRLVPPGPGVLVNISDDAWYGRSAARFQHLNIARFRAIENHRYLLRATNDGITAVIDPYGRVIATAPQYQQAVLAAHFGYESQRTFYSAHGDVFAWSCVTISVIVFVWTLAGTRISRHSGSGIRNSLTFEP
ncbi:MAG TPA: apolipoprotein N-acyltransferase [Terriglobia bacterium]|nr:apolipoprotein N-acyltransferase [Terriglobia bacterium]